MSTQLAHPTTFARAMPAFPPMIQGLLMQDTWAYGIVVKVVEITPEAAEAWLKTSSLPLNTTDEIRIQNPHDLDGKAIIFDFEGNLVSGQDFLAACVAKGQPFTTLVVMGVSSDVEHEDANQKD